MRHEFNDHGVCTNPNSHDYSKPGNRVVVKTASKEGRWGFGLDVWNKKDLGGYGWGVNDKSLDFDSEQDAIDAALKYAFGAKNENEVSQNVQLSLF